MNPLLKEIRHNPLLWMLAFVPIVLIAEEVAPSSHTLLFVLAVLAIVPLAALLSHATESVAAKTGDAIGGLLMDFLPTFAHIVDQAERPLLVMKQEVTVAIITMVTAPGQNCKSIGLGTLRKRVATEGAAALIRLS